MFKSILWFSSSENEVMGLKQGVLSRSPSLSPSFSLDAPKEYLKICSLQTKYICLFLNDVHAFLYKALVVVMKMLLKHSVQLKLLWEASRANHPHLQTKRHLEKWHGSVNCFIVPCSFLWQQGGKPMYTPEKWIYWRVGGFDGSFLQWKREESWCVYHSWQLCGHPGLFRE